MTGDDFLQSPEVIKNYGLLNKLGIVDYVADRNKKIQDLDQLLADALDLLNRETDDELIRLITENLLDRFVPSYLQFVLKQHGDDDSPRTICFHNLKQVESPAPVDSLEPYNRLFSTHQGTMAFSLFEYQMDAPRVTDSLKPLNPEIIVPISGPEELYGIIVVGKKLLEGDYADEEIIYIDRLLRFASLGLQNVIHYRTSVIDYKTKLYNHSYFQRRLAEELSKMSRHGREFSVFMLDIDHFKNFNDHHGHLAGDKVLQYLSRTLNATMRQEDVIARFGGEEFVALLPESGRIASFHVAERIREEVEDLVVPYLGASLRVTVSIGVNHVRPGSAPSVEQVIEQVDQALYTSKALGRNRVTVYRRGLLFKGMRLRMNGTRVSTQLGVAPTRQSNM